MPEVLSTKTPLARGRRGTLALQAALRSSLIFLNSSATRKRTVGGGVGTEVKSCLRKTRSTRSSRTWMVFTKGESQSCSKGYADIRVSSTLLLSSNWTANAERHCFSMTYNIATSPVETRISGHKEIFTSRFLLGRIHFLNEPGGFGTITAASADVVFFRGLPYQLHLDGAPAMIGIGLRVVAE